jgi:hypothetical protein
MQTDAIEAVGIDDKGSLWVKPATQAFRYIYREGMVVHWDEARRCLYAPNRPEWTYVKWFTQIRKAAREQSVDLTLRPTTSWSNIDAQLRDGIIASTVAD